MHCLVSTTLLLDQMDISSTKILPPELSEIFLFAADY